MDHVPLPPPVPVRLTTFPAQPCAYLPNRSATSRAFCTNHISGDLYHSFMDASFRRSGKMIYQPVCAGCRACLPIRVLVDRFSPDKSQRRSSKRNLDLTIELGLPQPTDEKFDLYRRYQLARHEKDAEDANDRSGFESFLYDSPVDTIEFTYRNGSGKLLAVGICDICSQSLSSVYFYFDPDVSKRGIGTFGVLQEIAFAKDHGIPYYYLGYWVAGSPKMHYKSSFNPHQVLQPNGIWVDQ